MPIDKVAAARAIDAFLVAIGRDPAQEAELRGTGNRVAEAYVDDLCAGYRIDTRALLSSGALSIDAPTLIVVRDVPVTTTCPHHLLPAFGAATIALAAKKKSVGLGVLASVIDAHARRLTLQETIGESVVTDVADVITPAWVGCRIVLTHACMIARGERTIGARVETVALRGAKSAEEIAHVHSVLRVGT